jgi:hypothetical protein
VVNVSTGSSILFFITCITQGMERTALNCLFNTDGRINVNDTVLKKTNSFLKEGLMLNLYLDICNGYRIVDNP